MDEVRTHAHYSRADLVVDGLLLIGFASIVVMLCFAWSV